MVHIGRCIGSRRSKGRKMEVSRARSGSMRRGTLGTGKTIRKMASVFSSTRTATSMRAYGREIKDTAKALTGEMSLVNYVVNTQETGSKIRSMAGAHSSIKMEIVTMGTGSQACLKVRAA